MEGSKENLTPEEIIDNGLGLLVRQKRLYHGSGVKDIQHLNPADETTVGNGVYFTSEPSAAFGYAKRRSRGREGSEPLVYNAQIENLKLLDLRSKENTIKILEGFKSLLIERRKQKNLSWQYEATLDNAIEAISSGAVKSLREVTFSHGKLFTEYVQSLGYDGLVTIEGGEGDDIGEHDTYLIFDPNNVKELSTTANP